jgi:hydrogenase maturation protease
MRHVIFFGNALHGDDGFGPAVYQRLGALALPADVRLFEAGTCGLNALSLFDGCQQAIVVDALEPGSHPGRITQPPAQCLHPESSLPGHAAGLGFVLSALVALGQPLPSVIAAEAARVQPFCPGLSTAMQQAVEAVTRLLCQMLGIEPGPIEHG